ncbi:DUF1697 domain-containing protein [Actinophytocola sediminis]
MTTTHVALLRGINLGSRRRVAMADLRTWLGELGLTDLRTHLQSGNVVFRTAERPATVYAEVTRRLADGAGFAIDCVFRTAEELAAVVASDPFGEVATDPSRYLVSFLDGPVRPPEFDQDHFAPELFRVGEREVYFWVPDGVRNSKVLAAFPARAGEVATMRNWNTVTRLVTMTAP